MKKVLIVAACVMMASVASAAVVKKERGVFCDSKAHFCFDRSGISATYSQQYYGDAGMKRAEEIVKGNANWVTLSDGTDCHFDQQVCYVSKSKQVRDKKVSPALWGE